MGNTNTVSKIDLNRFKNNKHTVRVNLTFEDNGHSSTESMRVIYRGISFADAERLDERYNKAPSVREGTIEFLADVVIELPDLIDNNQPVQATKEFWDTLDTYYLNRIYQAITDDRSGKV